jgi:Na+-driven multidrug efflux pump
MIVSNMLQAMSGTVNNIYLGQMLGVGAMASVSAFFPVFFFLIAFMIGLGSGAAVLIGQAWGAKELERVKAIAGTTLMVGLLSGLIVAVFGGAFTKTMLEALGTYYPALQLMLVSCSLQHQLFLYFCSLPRCCVV